MNKTQRELYALTLPPHRSIEESVIAGHYEYYNPLINNANFPPQPTNWFVIAEMVCLHKRAKSSEVIEQLAALDLQPASMKELLALRINYPQLSLSHPILALDAVLTKPDGQRFIGCLFDFAGEPNLGVIWERETWSPLYRFLAVPQ